MISKAHRVALYLGKHVVKLEKYACSIEICLESKCDATTIHFAAETFAS